MFLTSTQKQIMSGQQHNTESERQHLLDRLLDAVKQCQVRFGGKTELATDGDSRVVCLLTQLEAIFQHGFKKSRVSAFRQVGQAAGIVKLESDSVFWNFVKGHLEKLEVDRFLALEKATTDAGRGRAWLRSALNEHSLERYFHHMVGNKTLLSNFYEKEAFLMDEERASMLPMIAAGLSPILFALTVDSEDLNIVRQVPALTINKDVFSNILPSFPQKQVVEPAPVYSAALTDESKQEKKRKKKKKKRNAAIVSIEEDDSFQVTREHVKDFPLDDSTVEETFKTNSDSKTSTTGHTRSSSYPGNIVVVAEGTTEKKSRVNGQEIVFTEITKSISLPDNSMTVENIADSTTKATKTCSFDFEDFLEKVSSGPRYDTVAEGVTVQETTTGDDRGNFNFDAAGLFLNQLKVDSHERNVPQLQNATKSDNSKETSSAAPTVSKATSTGYLRQIQGDLTVNESDLLQRRNVSEGESFDGRFSSTKSPYSQAKEDSPRLEQKLDSSRVYRLADEGSSNGLNFSLPQTQVPTVLEKTTSDTELANESQGSAPEHVDNLHISKVSVEEDSSSAQESYDLRQSPSGKTFHQERTGNRRETDEDKSPSGLYDSETETISESQSVEPVVLLDGGEPLVPLAEGGDTAKTGAQSTFYYVPDVSADNDQDSASVSSASWSYVEDVEEFSEKKDESLLNNRSSSAMTSDASAAVAALAACSDAQRGMDNMSRGFVALERTTGDQSAQRDYSSRHDGMSTGELKQAIVSMMLRKDEIEEKNRNLQSELDEMRYKSQQLSTETEELREELKQQENFNTAKIASLSRENELLKHQLKKYVGAVQALRSDLQGKSSETVEVLSGIRQDDVLPPLPPERNTEQARQSEEAEEYKRKLIQVADLHGELLEFNDRLHKQVNYYQYQVRRLREELVNLRGPLPEDLENLDHTSSLSDFDPAVMSVGTRPLVNVWIPSVFLRGRSSNVHHVYQVYVRIKDDEWNVYRRYSQFFDMHKTLRRKFAVVDSFKFPPKKTLGNKDSRFVEDRRRLLQDYLRRVVNLYVTSDQELRSETTKNTLLQILPFFAEPLPPEKAKKEITSKRKRSVNYSGL